MNGLIIKNKITDELTDIAWPLYDGTFNLRYADLSGANLRYANLRYANLSGADLRGAKLSGADLYILGQCQRGYTFLLCDAATATPRITAGCRVFSLDDAKSHWTSAHGDDPVLRAHCLAMVATAEAIIAAIKAA